MSTMIRRRAFLATGVSLAAAFTGAVAKKDSTAPPRLWVRREIPRRMAKTTKLFKSPGMAPNALAVMTDPPGGLWIGQQKLSGTTAELYHVRAPRDPSEAAWLVDWNGNLLKTVTTRSRNTSGMAYGDRCVWMVANEPPEGVFQVDVISKQISHRQIPLGPPNDGGGSHGAQWHEGKLWIVANRLRALMRVDPVSWNPEFMIPIPVDLPRWHDMTFDQDGYLWQVIGNNSTSYADGKPGLIKYDPKTGEVLEIVEFAAGSSDPHGLACYEGMFVSCDAGIHPGWPINNSPTSGWIFRIDLM